MRVVISNILDGISSNSKSNSIDLSINTSEVIFVGGIGVGEIAFNGIHGSVVGSLECNSHPYTVGTIGPCTNVDLVDFEEHVKTKVVIGVDTVILHCE